MTLDPQHLLWLSIPFCNSALAAAHACVTDVPLHDGTQALLLRTGLCQQVSAESVADLI